MFLWRLQYILPLIRRQESQFSVFIDLSDCMVQVSTKKSIFKLFLKRGDFSDHPVELASSHHSNMRKYYNDFDTIVYVPLYYLYL